MAAKTLILRGSSMAARFLNSTTPPLFPTCSHKTLLSQSNLFPLSNLPHQFPFFHQYDAVSPTSLPYGQIKDVELVNDFYPFGHPSLDFFLPSANDSDSESDPMILFPKRPFQPSTLRRKRVHGFFARKATKGGRRVIARRVAKGRHRITA